MNSVIEAEQLGIRYVPRDNRSNAGRKSIISIDSQEAQIIADSMESGMSIVCAWGLVNAHFGKTKRKKNFWKVLFPDPLQKTNSLNLLSTDFLQKLEKSEA